MAEENEPLIGEVAEDGSFINETPNDIINFMTEQGFKDSAYVCTMKRYPLEGSEIKEFLPGSWKSSYPSKEEIGKRFGPANYLYCFSWKEPDAHGKRVGRMKEFPMRLGEAWDDIHDEYMSELYFKKEANLQKLQHKARLKKAQKGRDPDSNEAAPTDPIGDLKNSMTILKDFGVPMGNSEEGLSSNTQMMMLMMKMQQQSQDSTMKMFMMMSKQNSDMMMNLAQSNKQPTNKDHFGDILEMLKGTMDLKELLSPEKKGVVDKVFELLESLMPSLMQLAQQPRAQRAQSPLIQAAKSSDEFSAIQNDPNMLNEIIKKMDTAHGAKQTDVFLETVGWKRPGAAQPAEPEIVDAPIDMTDVDTTVSSPLAPDGGAEGEDMTGIEPEVGPPMESR